jgi:hypothetical protein
LGGSWAYALRRAGGRDEWIHLDLSSEKASGKPVAREEWARFRAPEEFKRAVAAILVPGSTIVVTPDSLQAGSTGTALTIIEAEQPKPR